MIRVTVWNEYIEEKLYEHVAKVYPEGIHNCIADFLSKDQEIQVRCVTLSMPDQGLSEEILNQTDVLIWWGHQAHDKVTDENANRVKEHVLKGMGFIPLHSAHGCKPLKLLLGTSMCLRWKHDEKEKLICVNPSHPIAEGITEPVYLKQEEMYGEYFDIPKPDDVIFIDGFQIRRFFVVDALLQEDGEKYFIFSPVMKNIPFIFSPPFKELLKMLLNGQFR